jgi:ubiquinone/menaquinone biosynthesis C-methylase UbiE
VAEELPYENGSIDCVLMVTTICFVDDAEKTFREVYRVLKKKGSIIIAFVDKSSVLGKIYQSKKMKAFFIKTLFFTAPKIFINSYGATILKLKKRYKPFSGSLMKLKIFRNQ